MTAINTRPAEPTASGQLWSDVSSLLLKSQDLTLNPQDGLLAGVGFLQKLSDGRRAGRQDLSRLRSIFEALPEPETSKRKIDLLSALAELGVDTARPDLEALVKNGDNEIVLSALGALVWLRDPASVPVLQALFEEDNLERAIRIAPSLGHFGDSSIVGVLCYLLDHQEEIISSQAALALGMLGDAAAIPILAKKLASESDFNPASTTLEYLAKTMARENVFWPDSITVACSGSALRKLLAGTSWDKLDTEVLTELRQLLKHKNDQVAMLAALALGDCRDVYSLPVLKKFIEKKNQDQAWFAYLCDAVIIVSRWERVRNISGLNPLISLGLKQTENFQLFEFLARLGLGSGPVRAYLKSLIMIADSTMKKSIIDAIRYCRDSSYHDELLDLSNSDDAGVASLAALALLELGDQSIDDEKLTNLLHNDASFKNATLALERLDPVLAMACLEPFLSTPTLHPTKMIMVYRTLAMHDILLGWKGLMSYLDHQDTKISANTAKQLVEVSDKKGGVDALIELYASANEMLRSEILSRLLSKFRNDPRGKTMEPAWAREIPTELKIRMASAVLESLPLDPMPPAVNMTSKTLGGMLDKTNPTPLLPEELLKWSHNLQLLKAYGYHGEARRLIAILDAPFDQVVNTMASEFETARLMAGLELDSLSLLNRLRQATAENSRGTEIGSTLASISRSGAFSLLLGGIYVLSHGLDEVEMATNYPMSSAVLSAVFYAEGTNQKWNWFSELMTRLNMGPALALLEKDGISLSEGFHDQNPLIHLTRRMGATRQYLNGEDANIATDIQHDAAYQAFVATMRWAYGIRVLDGKASDGSLFIDATLADGEKIKLVVDDSSIDHEKIGVSWIAGDGSKKRLTQDWTSLWLVLGSVMKDQVSMDSVFTLSLPKAPLPAPLEPAPLPPIHAQTLTGTVKKTPVAPKENSSPQLTVPSESRANHLMRSRTTAPNRVVVQSAVARRWATHPNIRRNNSFRISTLARSARITSH